MGRRKQPVGRRPQDHAFFFAIGAFVITLLWTHEQSGFSFASSFITISIFLLGVALFLAIVSWTTPGKSKMEVDAIEDKKGGANVKTGLSRSLQERVLFFCAGLLLFIYVGAESTYGGLVYTYAVTVLVG